MDLLILFVGVPVGLSALMACSLWLGFRWDRARGRWRCPRCWYDRHDAVAEGGEIGACPECGHKPRRPGDLQRTRRSRPLILLGFSLIPVIVWWVGALGGGRGLLWPIPNFVLVRLQVFTDGAVRSSWVDQLVRTEVGTRRNSGRWPAETEAELAQSMARTPLVQELNVPKRWPAGTPVPILIDGDGMLGPYVPSRVEITVESGGESFGPFASRDVDVRRVFASAGAARPIWVFFAPPMQNGEVVVDVRARWRAGPQAEDPFVPGGVDETARFPVEPVPDLESVLDRAPAAVTETLRNGWSVGLVRGGINVRYPEDESLKGVSLGMSLELWCGSVLVASGEMWLPNFPREATTTGQFCALEGHGATLTTEQIDQGPWVWRVRSSPMWGAIGGQLECTSAWAGEFESRASKPSARWLRSILPEEARASGADGVPR